MDLYYSVLIQMAEGERGKGIHAEAPEEYTATPSVVLHSS